MYRRAFLFVTLIVFICSAGGCGFKQVREIPAPGNLPGISRCMKSPGFWIARHPGPDEIIMTPEEIRAFNRHGEKELGLIRDIPAMESTYPGHRFVDAMEKRLVKQRLKKLFFKDGRLADRCFHASVRKQMDLENVPHGIPLRYGIVTGYASQRVLPLREGLYADPDSPEFDRLQNSGLDMGTPLAVLHASLDGRWRYVISPLSSGWVETSRIAFCSHGQLAAFTAFDRPDSFVVATAPKADIYLDPERREFLDYVRMGTRLGVVGIRGDLMEVLVPGKDCEGRLQVQKGYVQKKDVSLGFLPYTPRNIITQGFAFLNAPYGWGGMHGEQDCSRFIQAVFSTVGICLPRNSSAQAKSGVLLAGFDETTPSFEKIKVLSGQAQGGTTLLYLKGHIMLYLGEVDQEPHVIHALWGYGDPAGKGDRVRVVNSVRVTNLSLGAGSIRGSLLDRLVSAKGIF